MESLAQAALCQPPWSEEEVDLCGYHNAGGVLCGPCRAAELSEGLQSNLSHGSTSPPTLRAPSTNEIVFGCL